MALLGKNANKSVKSSNYIEGISRTKCPRHFKWRSTFSSGSLIPLFCDEFLPAETKSVDFGTLCRSITPLGPTMDNMFLDIFCFFVPRRLVWDHWEEFIAGYNKEAWAQNVTYEVPKIIFKKAVSGAPLPGITGYANRYTGCFLDYMPGAFDPVALYKLQTNGSVNVSRINQLMSIDACYPRPYVKIWNDWFRDENLQDEYELYTGDDPQEATAFSFDLLDSADIPHAAKYHNRFTSALPSPVKGPDVLIPMNNLQVGNSAKIEADNTTLSFYLNDDETFAPAFIANGSSSYPVVARNVSNTIRMLRLATQTELLLARDARGGTRYVESLLSHFGVHNGDARLQRSEYLGSRQIPLNIMQVTNTSQSEGNALGNVGGQSVTKDNAHYFTYSATEHGILWIVGVVRTNISYDSGIRKIYQRFTRFDHIWPEFKHIGDVPLYSKEIKIDDTGVDDGTRVFGYTPYGSEIREGYNFNNGLFRGHDEIVGSLSYLSFLENYTEVPTLSGSYIEQSEGIVSNTLTTDSGPQFYALFDLYMEDTIPLDPTSDPGLMDHF